MLNGSLKDIANVMGINEPAQNVNFAGLSIDTRSLKPGNLFIAIKGERFDGHDFIEIARKQGASAALVERQIDSDLPQLVTPDTILQLGLLASAWRERFALPIVAVTGSNGKTTLKNMLTSIFTAACQNHAEFVLATEGNLNNHLGLPLNLARLNDDHRYAVLEMGMNHFGEIEYLTKLTKPNVAVITNAAEAHLAGLGSVAGVAKAKGEIFSGLDESGIAILNRDDAFFDYWRSLIGNKSFLTFGLENTADITAHGDEIITPKGKFNLKLRLLGKHNLLNALAATAAAIAVNIPLDAIKQGLENVQPAPGRMHQYQLKNLLVIDDTYNANPFSVQAAAQTLSQFDNKKIFVLGDMKELGAEEKDWHYKIGEKIKACGIDYLFTFGNLSLAAKEGFGENAQHFTDREALVSALKPYLTDSTTVLIKGSRSMQMEKIVAAIIPAEQLAHSH